LETPANWRVCLVGQIGKFYTYREGRNAAALALFDAIKKQLDPQNIMNPGVLK
jgi:FAD/FMN-containing dehydrogenase